VRGGGALGSIGDARAVEPLITSLSDNDSWLRWNASEALGNIGDARAIEPLITTLDDEGFHVPLPAAGALGNIGKPAAEALIALLGDENHNFRDKGKAVFALGETGDTGAIKLLEKLAQNDPDSRVRQAAEKSLVRIREARNSGASHINGDTRDNTKE